MTYSCRVYSVIIYWVLDYIIGGIFMDEIRGHCGTYCNKCTFREKVRCRGCKEMKGKLFWGECDIYKCSNGNNFDHCGCCSQLPCDDLKEYIKNGHNPDRLKNLKKWRNENHVTND